MPKIYKKEYESLKKGKPDYFFIGKMEFDDALKELKNNADISKRYLHLEDWRLVLWHYDKDDSWSILSNNTLKIAKEIVVSELEEGIISVKKDIEIFDAIRDKSHSLKLFVANEIAWKEQKKGVFQ